MRQSTSRNKKKAGIILSGYLTLLFIFLSGCSKKTESKGAGDLLPAAFSQITIEGELQERIQRNFDRLEEGKYQPKHVFLSEEESGSWPGDTEGRTILGLVLDAQASHRTPVYLEQIIKLIPLHLNASGYMGPVYEEKMNEQQLSGNGWMLRGLCEYYEWKKNEQVLAVVRSIVNNLFVKGKGKYSLYPIDPSVRNTKIGTESGFIQMEDENWMLSSDVGCVFIGMEGLIHAYKHVGTPEVKAVIEEMIQRFLEVDLIEIKAQTHASLTACRGLVRYAELTGEKKYLTEAEKRWDLYKKNGMTENHENYNWFGRFDTWTEPCAIVDSYLLSVQLWQHTRNPKYRDEAELIYYNALCHTQRHNGGFGCDNCPGNKIHDVCLKVHIDEAHWCCTMRGAEGLSRAAQYAYFLQNDTVYVPFYHAGKLTFAPNENHRFSMQQQTNYPFENEVTFEILDNTRKEMFLSFAVPSYMKGVQVKVNGTVLKIPVDKGFLTISESFVKGDRIELFFDMQIRSLPCINPQNTNLDQFLIYYGPLQLGSEQKEVVKLNRDAPIVKTGKLDFTPENKDLLLTPVYHLMDPKVKENSSYKKQILF